MKDGGSTAPPAARLSTLACLSSLARRSACLLLLAGGLAGTVTVHAGSPSQTPAPPVRPPSPVAPASIVDPTWKELSVGQQQALSPLVTVWDTLDAPHKSKWLEISRRFMKMSPQDQLRIQERMRAWVALTPEQRRVARESYSRTKKLNTDQKSAQWQQYQQLPEEQKKKLAAEAAKNKVATLPPANSKPRVVPPLKPAPKQAWPSPLPPATMPAPVPVQTQPGASQPAPAAQPAGASPPAAPLLQ